MKFAVAVPFLACSVAAFSNNFPVDQRRSSRVVCSSYLDTLSARTEEKTGKFCLCSLVRLVLAYGITDQIN